MSEGRGATETLRVLLVEDDERLARILALTLRSFGHVVEVAGTVADAEKLAAAGPFDILVSDFTLPDGNAVDLLPRVRAAAPLPGIVLSGYGESEDVERSLAAGFSEHLTKPLEGEQLDAAIRRVVGGTVR